MVRWEKAPMFPWIMQTGARVTGGDLIDGDQSLTEDN